MCPSRKRMTSVMNHGGFGELTMKVNGIDVVVPKNFVFNSGKIKKKYLALIDKLSAGKIGVKEFYSYAK